jgi:hypothetical protein
MRVGLLSKFWGSFGMALGVAALILLVQFSLIFFIYLGLLLIGKLPRGRPPAWAAGVAIPWPTPGERMAKEIEPKGEAPEPEEAPEPDGERSSGDSGGDAPPRRKRKRRG